MKVIFSRILLLTLLMLSVSVFASEAIPDQDITRNIKNTLANKYKFPNYAVEIVTKNGIVILNGKVNTDEDAGIIIREVQATKGVKDVDASRLKVKNSKHPFEDTVITAKVKGKFIEQELFGKKKVEAMDVHVTTRDGVVYLTGKADDKQQAENAIAIAKSVKGVKKVESKILSK